MYNLGLRVCAYNPRISYSNFISVSSVPSFFNIAGSAMRTATKSYAYFCMKVTLNDFSSLPEMRTSLLIKIINKIIKFILKIYFGLMKKGPVVASGGDIASNLILQTYPEPNTGSSTLILKKS